LGGDPEVTSHVSRRYVTGDGVTIAHFVLTKGGVVPRHSHLNEQISYVWSGKLEYRFDDHTYVVGGNELLQIPGNVAHEVTALEDSIVVDVFDPIRQDWLDHTDTYFTSAPGKR
jgi:unsaturated pyranuronate lyase